MGATRSILIDSRGRRGAPLFRLAASACAWLGVAGGTGAAAGDEGAELLRRLVSGWPASGAVIATFEDEWNVVAVGYEFRSGAWFLDQTLQVSGIDPTGRFFSGEPRGKIRLDPRPPHVGMDAVLDPFFPQLFLRGVLGRPDVVREVRELPEGGWEVVASLPRGSREFLAAELPATEVSRWGGPEKLHRDVRTRVNPDLTVSQIRVEDGQNLTFDRDPGSPPGFQVVNRCTGRDGLRLTDLRVSEAAATDSFTAEAVERASRDRRGAARTPVATVSTAPPRGTIPMAPGAGGGGRSWIAYVAAGVVLCVIGALLWYRRHAAR